MAKGWIAGGAKYKAFSWASVDGSIERRERL